MEDAQPSSGIQRPSSVRLPSESRTRALAAALMVTGLWSSSWVLIKVGLQDLELPPIGFAGLRYTLAAAVLLPFAARRERPATGWWTDRGLVGRVLALGLLYYTLTQGAQFAALGLLPAVAVSLVLTSTPLLVALLSGRALGEAPRRAQLVGIGGLLAGAVLYFGPLSPGPAAGLGLLIAGLGALANALSALLGRSLAREAEARLSGVLPLTAISMAFGGVLLLGVGLSIEGPPRLTPAAWLVIAWLALVNTALAFSLWNYSLKVLTAVESSVLNNMMLVQIAALAWIFLGESLELRQLLGLALATAGVLLVQLVPSLAAGRN